MKKQLESLKERGLIAMESHAGKVEDYLESGSRTFYIGFDPTADSLHLGHLFQIMNMYRLSQFGHRPICIIGGGTALIGDPSGRTEMRNIMTPEVLETNRLALQKQVSKLLQLPNVEFLNNADWLLPLNYLEFMRDYGVHFSVNELIKKDIYRERLEREEGLTVFELNYILLQSYDFLYLNRNYDCTIQLGAQDQWSNILGGVDLIKKCEGKEAYAVVSPLLTRSDGKKMGKSESGAVWLDINKTSSYEFYQYFINIPDADVEKFMKIFTLLPIPEIENHIRMDIREAKKVLALEVTKFVHGVEEAQKAAVTSESLFGDGNMIEGIEEFVVEEKYFKDGKIDLVEFLVGVGIISSKREAREFLSSGAIYIDDIAAVENLIEKKDFLLRVGKKKYFKVTV